MKYLGIIDTMVIIETENKTEARKELDHLCSHLQLDSKKGQILCTKASNRIVKVNLVNTPHEEPVAADISKAENGSKSSREYGYWMERTADVGSSEKDWFCSECGSASGKRKTKY